MPAFNAYSGIPFEIKDLPSCQSAKTLLMNYSIAFRLTTCIKCFKMGSTGKVRISQASKSLKLK